MYMARNSVVRFVLLALLLAALLPQAALSQEAGENGAAVLYLPALHGPGSDDSTTLGKGDPNAPVVATVAESEQAGAAAFWTRERMLLAQPLDLLTVNPDQVAAAAANVTPGGVPVRVPGRPPARQSLVAAQTIYAEEWARIAAEEAQAAATEEVVAPAGELEAATASSAPPFVSYYVNDATETWKRYPWITMGRLFFKIPGLTGTYACSASVAYGRAVWTAGHCVYTQGRGWHTNLYFVPAYRNGSYPYGSFTVKSMTALSGWVYDHNLAYDIGMVAVNDRSGLKVSQWVGYLGLMYNYSGTQMFHAFGYPGNYAYGQYLVTCAASTYVRDSLPGPAPIGIGCDMGSGASGGPWLTVYAPFKGGATNYVNSVVSYAYAGRPLETFGPYFGDGAKQLYDWGRVQ